MLRSNADKFAIINSPQTKRNVTHIMKSGTLDAATADFSFNQIYWFENNSYSIFKPYQGIYRLGVINGQKRTKFFPLKQIYLSI